jgi:hypothetical protein
VESSVQFARLPEDLSYLAEGVGTSWLILVRSDVELDGEFVLAGQDKAFSLIAKVSILVPKSLFLALFVEETVLSFTIFE